MTHLKTNCHSAITTAAMKSTVKNHRHPTSLQTAPRLKFLQNTKTTQPACVSFGNPSFSTRTELPARTLQQQSQQLKSTPLVVNTTSAKAMATKKCNKSKSNHYSTSATPLFCSHSLKLVLNLSFLGQFPKKTRIDFTRGTQNHEKQR